VNPALFAQRRNVGRLTAGVGAISVVTLTDAADDFTASGYVDWLYLGSASSGTQDDKLNGANVITGPTTTNMTRGNSNGVESNAVQWSNGTSTGTATGITAVAAWMVTSGGTKGTIDFTVPAGVASHKARVLVGTYVNGAASAAQVVRFTLSDASASEVVVTPNQNLGSYGTVYTLYECTYNAASNSKTLRIRSENTPGDAGWDNFVMYVTYK
jgi:hypothetical protein